MVSVVLDGVIWSLQRAGGGSLYWAELAAGLAKQHDLSVKLIAYENDNVIYREYAEKLPQSKLGWRWFGGSQRVLPCWMGRDLCIASTQIYHSSYYRRPLPARKRVEVVTVHDFMPEMFGQGVRARAQHILKANAIRRADKIICVSHNTRRDLARFFPAIDEQAVAVVYNGVSDQFRPSTPGGSAHDALQGRPFAIYVGTRGGYKNFEVAVNAVAIQREIGLVVVGGGVLTVDEESQLKRLLGGRYIHYPRVSTEVLNALYNNAFCLVYPSSYEGFGLPVLEAMKAGCPVVAVNTSSVAEIGRGAAQLASSANAEEIALLIDQLLDATRRREVVRAGIERARQFSWTECVARTADVYRSLV